jgi:hypothetical protein
MSDKELEVINENKEIAAGGMDINKIMALAVEKGDLDKVEKMMELQERFEAREARKDYVVAMSAFRAECPTIIKTKEAYNNKYAGLAETIAQIKSLLAKCGLSHSWKIDNKDKEVSVTCFVTHIGGHQESTTMTAPPDTGGKKNPIQEISSTVSYLERYTLYAILGLASAEMDDDGAGSGAEYINDEQMATINEWIESIGGDCLKNFKKYMGVDELDKILAKDYKKAITALQNTAKKKEGAK